MRSRPFLGVIWVAGTLIAIGIVWQSLSFVSTRTEDGSVGRSLAAAGPALSLPASPDPGPSSVLALPPGLSDLPPGLSSVSSLPALPPPGGSPGSATAAAEEDDEQAGGGASPTTTAATGSTRSGGATAANGSTTTSVPAEAVDQTLVLAGGSAMVRYSAGGVKVLWATPADGYTARIEPENDGVRVEFRSSHHRSRLLVWWSGGPQYQVREDSGGDGEH